MKTPEKIYIGTVPSTVEPNSTVYTTVTKDFPGAKEYINKEALIDKLYKRFEEDTTVADYYTKDSFAKVVDKLFK